MTVIRGILFDPDRFEATKELFPDVISKDDWIVYHGTSSLYEFEIDSSGFRPSSHIAGKEEVQAVVSVYERMNWAGAHGGGFPVLKAFSLEHDLADPRGKHVYFAESSCRASLYAMRDFAGGECARALRHALRDLQEYLEYPLCGKNMVNKFAANLSICCTMRSCIGRPFRVSIFNGLNRSWMPLNP